MLPCGEGPDPGGARLLWGGRTWRVHPLRNEAGIVALADPGRAVLRPWRLVALLDRRCFAVPLHIGFGPSGVLSVHYQLPAGEIRRHLAASDRCRRRRSP
jgi:hypothetical protein